MGRSGGIADEVTRCELGGVPAFVAPRPPDGPNVRAALMFRVGRADEELARFGLTHLVEHLTMFRVGRVDYAANAFVDDLRTVFYAGGEPHEVSAFLSAVAAGLRTLPLERLESEKRVLETESQATGPSVPARLLARRFGAASFGLAKYRELGLLTATAEDVEGWARGRFTRRNACLWVAGDLPDVPDLDLPEGTRVPPPPLDPLPRLRLPAYVQEGSGGVVLGALVERGYAGMVAMAIASDRLHDRLRIDRALSYDINGGYDVLGADCAHVMVGADCLDEHAADVRDEVVRVVDELAVDGPTVEELDRQRDMIRRAGEQPGRIIGLLDGSARDELFGRSPATPAQLDEELDALEGAHLTSAMHAIRASAVLMAPEGVPLDDDRFWGWGEWESPGPVTGRKFGRRPLELRGKRVGDVVLGEDGVTMMMHESAGGPVTIPFDECVTVTTTTDGNVTLVGVDETQLTIVPIARRNGEELVAGLREAIPAWKWVAIDGAAQLQIEEVANRTLKGRLTVRTELRELAHLLQAGEKLEWLAQGSRGLKRGLVALTDRRLLFVYRGVGKPIDIELPYERMSSARAKGLTSMSLVVKADGEKWEFTDVTPRANAGEMVAFLDSVGVNPS